MNRKRPVVAVVAFCCLGAIACDRPSADASYQVTDSAGVKLVMNGTEGTWTPDQAWQFREDLRVESPEAESARQFGILAGVAVNSRGEIFVLDRSVPNIQAFDADGVYLRTIGGAGSGPGQFGRIVQEVLAGAGDSLTVPDMANQRVNVFSPDGQFVRSFTTPIYPNTPVRWATLPDSRLAVQINAMVMPGQSVENRTNTVVRMGPAGAFEDTLLSLPLDPILDLSQGPASMKTRVFNSTAAWATNDAGRVVFGMTGDYRLSVYDGAGTLQLIFAKRHDPVPVSDADRESVRTSFKAAMQEQMAKTDNAQVRGMMEQVAANIEFGATYPAFGAVVAGPDDTWLVRRPATVREVTAAMANLPALDGPPPRPEWDVFDADGRFLGSIQLPAGFRLAAVAGGKLYGIETDSLDIPSVIRLARTTGK